MAPAEMQERAALAGIRVVDCGGELGSYCTWLLAGLGADVVRVVPPAGDPLSGTTPYALYLNVGKRRLTVDPNEPVGRDRLLALAASADVVVETVPPGMLGAAGITWETLSRANRSLVLTRVTPFGPDGPHAGRRASDLTLMAQGGLMSLAGDPDSPPVRAAGRQSWVAAGIYAAVGTLLALLHAEATGEGQVVDVAALECIASSLENAVQYWDLQRTLRKRTGSRPREAGTGLYPCRDGHVYVMAGRLSTPRGWAAIVEWLNEAGTPGAEALRAPEWGQYAYRSQPEPTAYFTDLFSRFAAGRGKVELYEEGQRRGIIICPLNTPADLPEDRQLAYRRFFVPVELPELGRTLLFPGAPFRLSATPFRTAGSPRPEPSDREPAGRPAPRRTAAGLPAASPLRLPLAGIRVADFTWVGAGPFATKILADHGAEVIKIESAGRPDVLRITPPFRDGAPELERSGYFANRNTSKKSLTLNLSDPRGVELARRLIAVSDVVANNFAAGTMEKWGLGYEECRRLRPDVIYLAMPMHGNDGPHSRYLGYGAAMGALSGFYAATGFPDRDPVGTGTNYPDHVVNPGHAAIAVLAALRHRRRTGEGQAIELAQVESTVCALGSLVLAAQMNGEGAARPLRIGNREPGVAPHGVYPAAGDDRWIAIACWDDADWRALCRVAAGRDWTTDPRFASLAGRLDHEDDLDAAIGRWTAEHDPFELADRLQAAGVEAAPVQDARDVVERDPQLGHLDHWVRLTHAAMGECIYDAPPFHLSATPGRLRSPAPLLGEHTAAICRDLLGLADDEIERLREQGVLR